MKLIRFADVLGAWQIGEFFVRIVVFFFSGHLFICMT